jgi:hypothetical protein
MAPLVISLSFDDPMVDPEVNVKVEETKAVDMEK